MRKSILITALLALFVCAGSNAIAQTEKSAKVTKIEKVTTDAIKTIKDDKTLSEDEKARFIKRLNALSKVMKAEGKTMADFESGYKGVASNYARITNKALPAVKTTKSGN